MKREMISAWIILGLALTLPLQMGCATSREATHPDISQDEPAEEGIPPRIFLEPAGRATLPPGVEPRRVYKKGVDITAAFEGYRRNLYNDAAGYCTIGIGHLIKLAKCDGTEPEVFRKGLDKAAALKLLAEDMAKAEVPTQLMIKVDLTDGQFAALCDFAYNCGTGRLRKSDMVKYINDGEFDKVAAQLRRYTRAGGKELAGLVRRREKEIELFYEGMPIPRGMPGLGEDTSPIDLLESEEDE